MPPLCLHCRRPLATARPGLCAECLAAIVPLPSPRCRRCDLPRPGAPATCGRCRSWPSGLSAVAGTRYEGPAASVVRGLKYGGWRHLAELCAVPMARSLATGGHDPTILVPVLLHSVRRRERGFDQARLLADALGRRTGRPVVDALRRRRPTPSQVGLGRAARAANVRDAFGSTLRLGGERVGLVDDVATSGATLVASATPLLEAGAGRVTGVTWALALAPADR